jgi:hypothetical protein
LTKDIYHENMKKALIKDGWTVTHDFVLTCNESHSFTDMGSNPAWPDNGGIK